MAVNAEIQAFDDPDGTIYRLRRDGLEDVYADVPHPLYELAPDAVRLPSVTGSDIRAGIVATVGVNPPPHDPQVAPWQQTDWLPHGTLMDNPDGENFMSNLLDRYADNVLPGWMAYDSRSAEAMKWRSRQPGKYEPIPGKGSR